MATTMSIWNSEEELQQFLQIEGRLVEVTEVDWSPEGENPTSSNKVSFLGMIIVFFCVIKTEVDT